MAKPKGARRVQQTWRRPRVASTVAVGALVTKDATSGAIVNASDSKYLLSSVELTYTWELATATEGPLLVGIAAGDYTAAEIEECIEAVGSINLDDKIAQEQSNRLVRQIATLNPDDVTANDGKPIKTKLNWVVAIGSQPQAFVYNQGAQTITTGSALNIQGHLNIRFI